MIILFTYLTIGILSCVVWEKYRKTRRLTDYTTIMNNHDAAARTAMWGVIIYLASLPILVLLYIGAVNLVLVKPSWNLSLSLTIIIFNILYMLWIVVIPLWNLCGTTVYLLAAEINVYTQNKFPLEYYESKPGFHNNKKRN